MEEGYGLDFIYIMECIIVVFFFVGCFEEFYLYNLQEVMCMFKFKYGDNYLVLNFLEKRYDFMKFNLKIMDVGWLEFYVLFLDKMCIICKVQEFWLNSNFQYVVVIYCRGGKGCIGVVILFYMYFINVLVSVDQVFDRFVMKKFYDDKVLVLMQFF